MLDPTDQKIVDDVADVGWSLIGVEADGDAPSFVYSVGIMHTLGHPEVVVFGLDVSLMFEIANEIGDEIRGGRSFREPGLYDGIVEGYACRFAPVAERRHAEYLGYAMWHRRHVGRIGTLEAVQCLWPDRDGRFPDEPACAPHVVRHQPLLQHP